MENTEFFAHFPPQMSQAIVDYVTDVVLLRSRYLFTRRVKGIQFAYCTHCKKEYVTKGDLKRGKEAACKKCKSTCKVKASGVGRKHLRDEAYFVYYEKSILDPKAITARGIHVIRDYSGDYRQVQSMFEVRCMYLFVPGAGTMFEKTWGGKWEQRKNVSSQFESSMVNKSRHISHESIEAAVKGTPFQYSTWERYCEGDLVKVFDLYARYPCIEYLTKLGLRKLVEAKLQGQKTYGAINWRGKTLLKVLKLTKVELNEIRSNQLALSPLDLYYFQYSKSRGSNITITEAKILSALGDYYYGGELKNLLRLSSLERINKYILKQLSYGSSAKHSYTAGAELGAWRDYLKDCQELGMDITNDAVLFPNNLYEAHQKTIRKVKIKADETLNGKIADRVKGLEKYKFEADGFFLRPAVSSIELFDEGKALQHCVGGYAKKYAEGKTNLFVIRKTSDPNTPFYTMEIVGQEIVQIRGSKNCSPTDEVKAFVQSFIAAKLAEKPKKSKVNAQIAQPA